MTRSDCTVSWIPEGLFLRLLLLYVGDKSSSGGHTVCFFNIHTLPIDGQHHKCVIWIEILFIDINRLVRYLMCFSFETCTSFCITPEGTPSLACSAIVSRQRSVSQGHCGRADNLTRWGLGHRLLFLAVSQTSWGLQQVTFLNEALIY